MLTVKLIRGNTTKIIEAVEVGINAAGTPAPLPEGQEEKQPRPLTTRVRAIGVKLWSGRYDWYYVGNGDAEAADTEERWDYAFIENAHGATTERVYAE